MENIKKQIEAWAEKRYINGAICAAVEASNTTMYSRGVFAKEEIYENIPVLPDAIFDLASLTKVIGTTTRILQLFDERKLSPTDLINPYLPFSMVPIQVKDLLLHQSGLPGDLEDKSQVSMDFMETYFKAWVPPEKIEPIYSDLGYLLLGFLIETIDGCSLEESFQKSIFRPLQMNQTTYFPLEKDAPLVVPSERTLPRELILGQVHDSKAWRLQKPAGSAGLFSTVNDLIRFVRIFLVKGSPTLSKKRIEELLSVHENGRTFGWEWLENVNTRPILFHTGFTGTSIGIDLQEKKALILLTNRVYYGRHHLVFLEERRALYKDFFQSEGENK